jgi:uncharacterized damage-inducible protein DinB
LQRGYILPIAEGLLQEFEQETAATRKTLERIPDDKYGWKPHDRSFSFGELASHVANIYAWSGVTLKEDSFEVSEEFKTPQAADTAELLEIFDKNAAEAREAIASTSDEEFMKTWTMSKDGRQLFAMPKIAVLRIFIFSHMIHHRGQLTVYLRMNDAPVPMIYGPSADEGM